MLQSTLRFGITLGAGILVTVAAVASGCTDDPATPPPNTGSSSGGTSGGGTSGGGTSSGGTSGSPGGNAGLARKAQAQVNPFVPNSGTTHGSATFTEGDGGVTLQLTVSNSPPGARGVHVHLGGSCDTDPGGHFNPNASLKNGEWDNMQVDDAGAGTLTSFRAGLTLEPAVDGGTGIVNRTLVVHAPPTPLTIDAGTPPPKSGCGVIQAQ